MDLLHLLSALLLISFSTAIVPDCRRCTGWVDDGKTINVHLVPHTHDDVGWLKTYEQYYYGTRKEITFSSVRNIITSVVSVLLEDPAKRFIYVESAYFWKWWGEQDDEMKAKVRKLVNAGRLEFIGGGWSMNDEATTHYSSIIDSMSFGHRFLHKQFGKCGLPTVAWQIDPFGHSREQASLFALMNFDGLFFARLDFLDKKVRKLSKKLEFVWSGSDDLGPRSDLFTSVLPFDYGPPKYFCFDQQCRDSPIVDDPESKEYNVREKVANFTSAIHEAALLYRTNHILVPMGEDFNFENAPVWFYNLDKLIKVFQEKQNNGSNLNLFYSSPSCYLQALNNANLTWPVYNEDFFPYSTDPHSYWAGYYTSRPSIKYYERFTNGIFQAMKQLRTLAGLTSDAENEVSDNFYRAMGVLQHHDAVTGTEKQHVANDYAQILAQATSRCLWLINRAYDSIMSKSPHFSTLDQSFCLDLNISQCPILSDGEKVAVTLYNPLAQSYSYQVRLPVQKDQHYVVKDPSGSLVEAVLTPIPFYFRSLAERSSNATHEIVFTANLTSLGFVTYFVEKTNAKIGKTHNSYSGPYSGRGSLHATGQGFKVHFDRLTGDISKMVLAGNVEMHVDQHFKYYNSMKGNNSNPRSRASGAYIFRPDGPAKNLPSKSIMNVFESPSLFEIQQKVCDYVYQTTRVRPNDPFIEIEYMVGPIPVEDGIGKEIVIFYETELNTNGVFYTDSNGRQLVKRIRRYKTQSEFEASNYYPVDSRIVLREEERGYQFVVLTDRSQGGTSLKDSSLELMLHRRILNDDDFGVNEALNEPGVDGHGLAIVGRHFISVTKITDSTVQHRSRAQKLYMPPLVTFAEYKDLDSYLNNYWTKASFLQKDLPENIHILSLDLLERDVWLLRLEHFYQSHEHPNLSKSVRVNLRSLFSGHNLQAVEETTLTGIQGLRDAKRMHWNKQEGSELRSNITEKFDAIGDFIITMKPFQIRTLILTMQKDSK